MKINNLCMRIALRILVAYALTWTMNAISQSTPAGAASTASTASTASSLPSAALTRGNTSAPGKTTGLDGFALIRLTELAQLSSPEKKEESGLAQTVALIAAIAWPLVALLALLVLLRQPAVKLLLERLPRHISQVTVAGFEFKLSPGAKAALADLETLIRTVPDTHKEWITQTSLGSDFRRVVKELREQLVHSASLGAKLSNDEFRHYRFTLHVPDVLLAHSFRQLTDYTGNGRGGAGRVFSMRTGIIGKAWRLEASQFEPNNTYSPQQLMDIWGMTEEEANDTKSGRKVHIAVLIVSAQAEPLAVLYADSADKSLFDPARRNPAMLTDQAMFDGLSKFVIEASARFGLTESLSALERERRKLRQIDLYKLSNQR